MFQLLPHVWNLFCFTVFENNFCFSFPYFYLLFLIFFLALICLPFIGLFMEYNQKWKWRRRKKKYEENFHLNLNFYFILWIFLLSFKNFPNLVSLINYKSNLLYERVYVCLCVWVCLYLGMSVFRHVLAMNHDK